MQTSAQHAIGASLSDRPERHRGGFVAAKLDRSELVGVRRSVPRTDEQDRAIVGGHGAGYPVDASGSHDARSLHAIGNSRPRCAVHAARHEGLSVSGVVLRDRVAEASLVHARSELGRVVQLVSDRQRGRWPLKFSDRRGRHALVPRPRRRQPLGEHGAVCAIRRARRSAVEEREPAIRQAKHLLHTARVDVVAVAVASLHKIERHAIVSTRPLPQHVWDRRGDCASHCEEHHDLSTRVGRTQPARRIVSNRQRGRETRGSLKRPGSAVVRRHPRGHRVGGAVGVGVRGKAQDASFGQRDEAWSIVRASDRQRVEADRRGRAGHVAEDDEVTERRGRRVPARSDEDRAVRGHQRVRVRVSEVCDPAAVGV